MPLNFSFFSRRVPDNVTEELVAALSGAKSRWPHGLIERWKVCWKSQKTPSKGGKR